MEDKERCPNKAEYLYGWNGKLIYACFTHATAMKKVGKAIGVEMEFQPINTGERCMHPDDLKFITGD